MATVSSQNPPTTGAIAIATAIIAGLSGYFLGQASSLGLFATSSQRAGSVKLSNSEESSDEEDEVHEAVEIKSFPDSKEECKLILVVRTDLGMTKGLSNDARLTSTLTWLTLVQARWRLNVHMQL